MDYQIRQWPPKAPEKEIDDLPADAAVAILVMLRMMRTDGPFPEGYKIKPLRGQLHGLIQASLKVNKEQIRVLYFVVGNDIVVVHACKKTSPQIQQLGYQKALDRMKTAKQISKEDSNGLGHIH